MLFSAVGIEYHDYFVYFPSIFSFLFNLKTFIIKFHQHDDTGEFGTPSYSAWKQQPARGSAWPQFQHFSLGSQVLLLYRIRLLYGLAEKKKKIEEILNKFYVREEGIFKRLRNLWIPVSTELNWHMLALPQQGKRRWCCT